MVCRRAGGGVGLSQLARGHSRRHGQLVLRLLRPLLLPSVLGAQRERQVGRQIGCRPHCVGVMSAVHTSF